MRLLKTLENKFGLPQGFTRVEYLQSTGTQYIDTGFIPNQDTRVVMKLKLSSVGTGGFAICGARQNSTSKAYSLQRMATGQWGGGYGDTTSGSSTAVDTNIHILTKDKNVLYLDDTAIKTDNSATFICPVSMHIFGLNNNGTASISSVGMSFWYFKVYDNGVLVRDFIPCLDPTGTPCMFDLVEQKAYYNKGTGSFAYGTQITPVDYLESTGTQYIDTYVNTSTKLKFQVDAQFDTYSSSYQLHGAFYNSQRFMIGVNASDYYSLSYVENNTTNIQNDNKRHLFEIDALNKTYSIDGVQKGTFSSDISISYKLYLFARKVSNNVDGFVRGKVYGSKIYDDNVLVRDYIPVRDENNVGYLFDLVSNTLYSNLGTGNFGVGGDVFDKKLRLIKEKNTRLPSGFKEVEYLESTGTQYIDTGYKASSSIKVDLLYEPVSNINTNSHIFGARVESTAGNGFGIGIVSSKFVFDYMGRVTASDVSIDASTKYRIVKDGASNNIYVNGTSVFSTANTATTFSLQQTMWLFKLNGAVATTTRYGKIYYTKVWDNNVLVRDFIPCLDANDTPCMYDLVEGKAYYNAGTGDFAYGSQIIPVEYIEGTGTQYIDTGYKPTNTTGVKIRHTICADNGTDSIVFGARENSNATRYWLDIDWNDKTIQWGFNNYSPSGSRYSVSGKAGDIITTSMNFLNDRAGKVDDVSYDTTMSSTTLASITKSIYLFRANYTSALPYSGKIYSLKISEGQNIVRDYIPTKDENGVGYMFDKISHTLYSNAGTGDFIVGNKINNTIRFIQDVVPSAYLQVNYIESTGTQYIDTGITSDGVSSISLKSTFLINNNISGTFGLFGQINRSASTLQNDIFASLLEANTNKVFNDCFTTAQTQISAFSGVSRDVIHNYELKYQNNISYAVLDGVQKSYTNTSDTKVLSKSLYLFKLNDTSITAGMSGRIYKLSITLNGSLVGNFVPVIRKSDNKPGLFDRVTKQFFTNQGTGEFNYE